MTRTACAATRPTATRATASAAHGLLHWTWGENIGCRDGYSTARAAVLASHRAFQAEKWTNGGHWQNIKNANDPSIGIGVWRYGSRTRLMTDFCR